MHRAFFGGSEQIESKGFLSNRWNENSSCLTASWNKTWLCGAGGGYSYSVSVDEILEIKQEINSWKYLYQKTGGSVYCQIKVCLFFFICLDT